MEISKTERAIANKIAHDGFTTACFIQMSNRHWLPIIALGVCLTGRALAQPEGANPSIQPGSQERYAIPIERVNPTDLSPIQEAIDRVARAVEVIRDNHDALEEQERAHRDLDAQESMAKWAEWMFWVAFTQAFLSGGGIWLIWKTLRLNHAATSAAIKAAKAAEDSALAAVDSVRVMRNADRPYLTPKRIRMNGFSKSEWDRNEGDSGIHALSFYLRIENLGPGPGIITTVETGTAVCRSIGQISAEPEGPRNWPGRESIASADSKHWQDPFHVVEISQEQRDQIMANNLCLFFYGACVYFDMFGVRRRTGFIFELYPPKPEHHGDPGVFVPVDSYRFWYDREITGDDRQER